MNIQTCALSIYPTSITISRDDIGRRMAVPDSMIWLAVIPIGIAVCFLIMGLIVFGVRRRLRTNGMADDALKKEV